MANIKQVAQYANLSPSCVSKYLKDPNSVRPDSRERIENAIRYLNYTPSPIARSLRSRKTNYIMVILRSIVTPFYYTLFNQIRLELEKEGYTAILQINDNVQPSATAFLQVDGVIMVLQDKKASLQIYSSIPDGIPVVMYSPEKYITDTDVTTVVVDLFHATTEMCQHLYNKGCRIFAYIGRSSFDSASQYRLPSFLDFIRQHPDCIAPSKNILQGVHSYGNDFQTGNLLTPKLLEGETLPDVIFCENDLIALGCSIALLRCRTCDTSGILVSGSDNIPMVQDFKPWIITQDYTRLPHLLCSELFHALNGEPTQDRKLIPTIIDRTDS